MCATHNILYHLYLFYCLFVLGFNVSLINWRAKETLLLYLRRQCPPVMRSAQTYFCLVKHEAFLHTVWLKAIEFISTLALRMQKKHSHCAKNIGIILHNRNLCLQMTWFYAIIFKHFVNQLCLISRSSFKYSICNVKQCGT